MHRDTNNGSETAAIAILASVRAALYMEQAKNCISDLKGEHLLLLLNFGTYVKAMWLKINSRFSKTHKNRKNVSTFIVSIVRASIMI